MMQSRNVAVICEMNPLHRGHLAILLSARETAGEDGTVIAVMSGNFVQRGTPAVFDRYTRAEAVIRAGADLVLELPYPWSSASAAYFASAGVEIANKTNVEMLCFGSEHAEKKTLAEIAKTSETQAFQEILQNTTPEIGEAAARERAFRELLPDVSVELLHSPNDTLAIAYISECKKCDLEWSPVKRVSGEGFLGATAIRQIIRDDGFSAATPYLAQDTLSLLQTVTDAGRGPVSESALAEYLFRVFAALGDRLPTGADGGGGVHERLVRCAAEAANSSEWLSFAATKKYTNARLRRAALFAVTGVSDDLLHEAPLYTTVLAANERGRRHLATLRKRADFTIITKPSDFREASASVIAQATAGHRADAIYTKLMPCPADAGFFLREKPVML